MNTIVKLLVAGVITSIVIVPIVIKAEQSNGEKELNKIITTTILPTFRTKAVLSLEEVVAQLQEEIDTVVMKRIPARVELHASKETCERKVTFEMRNVTIAQIITAICESQKLQWRIKEVVPIDSAGDPKKFLIELYDRTEHYTINPNFATRLQLYRIFNTAHAETRKYVANIMDYCDENHVLSTVGPAFGLEAVCFNEIMASDLSWIYTTNIHKKVFSKEAETEFVVCPVPAKLRNSHFWYQVYVSDNQGYGMYPYNHGRAVQQTSDGTVTIECILTGETACIRIYFLRPDIIELMNISEKPVSLKNWRLISNTGIAVEPVLTIQSAQRYNPIVNRQYIDENPVIKPGGYFYLTSNREIFAREYGDGDPEWGSTSSELLPVVEIPETNMVSMARYPICAMSNDQIYIKGVLWETNIMQGEIVFIEKDNTIVFGAEILSNYTRSIIISDSTMLKEIMPGDALCLYGLPRKGGLISLTMQNEYRQVTTRTTCFQNWVDDNSEGTSAQLYPGLDVWFRSEQPTFGGSNEKALNTCLEVNPAITVRNDQIESIEELECILFPEDIQQVAGGDISREQPIINTMKKHMTLKEIRLEAESPGAHKRGWNPAFAKAASNSVVNTIYGDQVNWMTNQWAGQTIKVLSGILKGESFPITGNGCNTIRIAGLSTEHEKEFTIHKGDEISLGPGYSTPLYYSRTNNDTGEWEWCSADITPGYYHVYLKGLNDSIRTTEFIEENFNADMTVLLYNFSSNTYDELCLDIPQNDLRMQQMHRIQYAKNDIAYCGIITSDYIGPNGTVRVRIIPRETKYWHGSWCAWFDSLHLVPMESE